MWPTPSSHTTPGTTPGVTGSRRAPHPSPWKGERHPAPTRSLEYDVLTPDRTVERRRLSEHPAPSA